MPDGEATTRTALTGAEGSAPLVRPARGCTVVPAVGALRTDRLGAASACRQLHRLLAHVPLVHSKLLLQVWPMPFLAVAQTGVARVVSQ